MDEREEAIWGRGFTMSLESGPAQWWHRRGISGQRVASSAAFMAPSSARRNPDARMDEELRTTTDRSVVRVRRELAVAGGPACHTLRPQEENPPQRKPSCLGTQISNSSGRDPASDRGRSRPIGHDCEIYWAGKKRPAFNPSSWSINQKPRPLSYWAVHISNRSTPNKPLCPLNPKP